MQQWYYRRGNNILGPVTSPQLASLVKTGEIDRQTPVRREGAERWIIAGSIKKLFPAETIAAPEQPHEEEASGAARKTGRGKYVLATVLLLTLAVVAAGYGLKQGERDLGLGSLSLVDSQVLQNTIETDPQPGHVADETAGRSDATTPEEAPVSDSTPGTPPTLESRESPTPSVAQAKSPGTVQPQQGDVPVKLTELGPITRDGGFRKTIFMSPNDQHVAVIAAEGSRQKVMLDGVSGPAYGLIATGLRMNSESKATPGVVFSPDSSRLAYVAKKAPNQFVVVVDGKESPSFHSIAGLQFSPDSKRIGYTARPIGDEGGFVVVVDDTVSAPFYSIKHFAFTPDSSRYAAVASSKAGMHIYSDGIASPPIDIPLHGDTPLIAFSPVGSRIALIARPLAPPRGKPGPYQVYIDGKQVAEFSGNENPQFDPEGFQFSPDGTKLACVVEDISSTKDNTRVYVDGTPGEACNKVQHFTFSPDSQRFAYSLFKSSDRATWVCIDGQLQQYYNFCYSIQFSPDSKHVAYTVGSATGAMHMVFDGKESPGYRSVMPGVFSTDSQHFAYVAESDGGSCVVLDGQPGEKYGYVDPKSLSFRPDGKLLYQARGNRGPFLVLDTEELGEAVTFSSDLKRRAWRSEGTLYIDGQARQRFNTISHAIFSPDGRRVAFIGDDGPSQNEALASVEVDGILGPQHVQVLGVCFSADSRHVCYVADESRSGLKTPRIHVDGWAGPEFEEIVWPRHFSARWSNEDAFGEVESARQYTSGLRFLEDGTMEFLAIRKETLYRVHVDLNHVIPWEQALQKDATAAGYNVIRELDFPVVGRSVAVLTSDGAILAATLEKGTYDEGGLAKLPLDGSAPTRILEPSSRTRINSMIVSESGQIFGTTEGSSTGYGLFMLDAEGENYRYIGPWPSELEVRTQAPRLWTRGKDRKLYGLCDSFSGGPKGFTVNEDGSVTVESSESFARRHSLPATGLDIPAHHPLGPLCSDQKFLYSFTEEGLVRMNHDFTGWTLLYKSEGSGRPGQTGTSTSGPAVPNPFTTPNANSNTERYTPEGAPLFGPGGLIYGVVQQYQPASNSHFWVIYSIKPDGTDFRIIQKLNSRIGPLVPGPNSAFYAIQPTAKDGFGRQMSSNALVMIPTDGSPIKVLHTFDKRYQGLEPAEPIVIHDGVLYGWTENGGRAGHGVLFRYNLPVN